MAQKHTLEELNNCSREELITIVLMMQGQLDALNDNIEKLIEQVRIANNYRFGRHTESLKSIEGQLSFFDEADAAYDESSREPSAEEVITAKRAKRKGQRNIDLKDFPEKILPPYSVSEEQLDAFYRKGNGGAHGWNIVRIGSKYYNVDCTWDGQGATTYNKYLLKSEADFKDHTRKSWKVAGNHYLDYTSAEFNAQYPMTEKSWDESTTYAHSKEATSGAVTLKAEWNDPVLGQPTTFHVSATGGSGNYKFRMDAPSYSDPNQWAFESVADPSRGEWINYTSECASSDYTFTMTATGTYNFRFYVMDMTAGVPYLRVNFNISVSDDKYPSVDSIVRSAVAECNSKTDGSEYEKALWLHDWLLDQLEYDKTLKWSSAESALTRELGTCQSYESAYAKLLTAAGIENSETRDTYDGHTWNAMKLDGQWYQTDCTWDDSSNNWYSFDQRHLYFGLSDELMAIAHPGHSNIYTADDYKTRSTSLADNYFVRTGDAEKWAKAYADRIQKNLDAGKTEFEITADNSSYPPSISGIQNGITAYAIIK